MPGSRPAPPAAPRTTAAVLQRAAGVIEANGWCQRSFADLGAACHIPGPRQVPVCAAGAIRIAAGHDPDDCSAQVPAMQVFAYWLSSRGHVAAQLRRAPTEVAAWAGHSVEVLMRTYAKCMTGLEDVWIARMNDTLHLEDGQAKGRRGVLSQ